MLLRSVPALSAVQLSKKGLRDAVCLHGIYGQEYHNYLNMRVTPVRLLWPVAKWEGAKQGRTDTKDKG